jgi:hypothetical protein
MQNFEGNKLAGNEGFDDPIPLDDELDKPIPLGDDDAGRASVSRSPLSLGGGKTAEAAKPVVRKAAGAITSSDRITGMKTFFTKLHPGAMDFLDEQINKWLKDNPGIVIKQTNTTTGEVQGKKTEPSIIITVWY